MCVRERKRGEKERRERETDKKKRRNERERTATMQIERSKIDWTVVEDGRRVQVLIHCGQLLRHN